MRLARFRERSSGLISLGLVEAGYLLTHAEVCVAGLEDVLEQGAEGFRRFANACSRPLDLDAVDLLAPLARPRKFLGIGGNFASHLEELARLGVPSPTGQIWFNKQTSCINGPFDDIILPAVSDQVDYEGELGAVIGCRCRHVRANEAHNVIAGYLVCNDVSVRDVQRKSPTATLGKSFDTHGPIGPWLVTADEIGDPQNLVIKTWINGELRQNGSTAEMRYSIADQIAELTSVFTLEPGDILATGTPAGIGAARSPPSFLREGDVVRVEIDAIGAIENKCVNEIGPAVMRQ